MTMKQTSRKWLVTMSVTVTVETDVPVSADLAIETAQSAVSQSVQTVVPCEGPENWAQLWTETQYDEATAEARDDD